MMHVVHPLADHRHMFTCLPLPVIITLKGSVYEISLSEYDAFHDRYLEDGHWIKLNCLLNCSFGCKVSYFMFLLCLEFPGKHFLIELSFIKCENGKTSFCY